MPVGVTQEEIQDIFDFFQYVGLKSIANVLGINTTYPNTTQSLASAEMVDF